MFDERNDPPQDLLFQPTIADTCFIAKLYLQRPRQFQEWSLGVWFNYCHELNDKDLILAVTGQETKEMIVRKGYNQLPLSVLEEHNKRASKY